MGNLLKHQYFDVEADVVWETLSRNLPTLHAIIQRLLNDMPTEKWPSDFAI